MPKDELFKIPMNDIPAFRFNAAVADVFDDMVNRSVPFYGEIQRMIAELAARHATDQSNIYDLGCSTGTTLLSMNKVVKQLVQYTGIDDAPEMLEKCKSKLDAAGFSKPVNLVCAHLGETLLINNASVVVMCLTLQFVPVELREKLLAQVVNGLNQGGVIILVEKILAENQSFNDDFIDYYYQYKRRNQYSELEIAQKREALENVLIPYTLSDNISMLLNTGFSHCEVFFKWYNFAGIIAIKK